MKYRLLFLLLSITLMGTAQSEDEQVNRILDSLQAVAEGDSHDTVRIDAYMTWDNAIYVSDQALDQEINERVLQICDDNLERTELNTREHYLFTKWKSLAHNNLGLVYLNAGNFLQAMDHLHHSYALAETVGDTSTMANATNNLGMIYHSKLEFERSLEFYRKSMELDAGGDESQSIYLNNIAMCYQNLGHPDSAMVQYRKSMALADRSGHHLGMANTLGNIGEIHAGNAMHDSAIFYYRRAIGIYDSLKNVSGHVFMLYKVGTSLLKTNRYREARTSCQNALDLLGSEKSLRNLYSCHDCLYQANKAMGNMGEALYHHELFIRFEDSLLDHEKKDELLRNEFQFEYAKKRMADSLNLARDQEALAMKQEALAKDKEMDQLKIREQETQIQHDRTQKIALFGGLGLVLIFSFLIYKRLRVARDQKVQIESQKDELEEKNREILDSITYAKRIQEAILPPDRYVREMFPESFILYKPKDIVAGDFYWFEQVGDCKVLAAADCTGHGVPGAMVSVVCHNALNRSVREFNLTDPGAVLQKTRDLVIETFEKSDTDVKDGMDVALVTIEEGAGGYTLRYAGANNPLWIVRGGDLTEYKPDKQPIGKYAQNKPYTTHEIDLQPGDQFYIFTDGYADQFGGSKGKKMKYKRLKELILSGTTETLSQQGQLLDSAFEQWKGDLEQLDDVCVIGVRV